MNGSPYITARKRRKGTVLIVAMWVVLVLAGLALVFARSVRVENMASANHIARLRATAAQRAGVQFAMAQVQTDDPAAVDCEARAVGDGAFWILVPDLEDDRTLSFGIRDEAARININTADEDMLLKLPGMTSELAAAIKDWRDVDRDVSPGGAEDEYYLLKPEPYYAKNGPFETVAEMLLVRGASPDMLYGEDMNRNGVLDPNENDGAESEPDDNRDGRLDRGLFDYITVYSRMPNVAADGQERVNVNGRDTEPLSSLLRPVIQGDRFYQVMDRVRRARPFQNIFDFHVRVGLRNDEFQAVADKLTTERNDTLEGRINVNTAPREILQCLPGLEDADVRALLTARAAPDTDTGSVAWVAEALPPEKAVRIGGHICARSYQYSADVVAVSGNGRAYRRRRVVMDATDDAPRVMRSEDLTHLGWPLGTERPAPGETDTETW